MNDRSFIYVPNDRSFIYVPNDRSFIYVPNEHFAKRWTVREGSRDSRPP